MLESSLIMSAEIKLSDNSIVVSFDNNKSYTLDNLFIKNKMHIDKVSDIQKIEIGMNGSELILYTLTDDVIIPWDLILCHFEPEYKYYCATIRSEKKS